jgi:3-oxoacyl-[acyl-carrier-protein] synthase-3
VYASLVAIEYALPAATLTNADLANEFPDWSVQKIEEKTGIASRRIAAPDQCASDLAVEAAQKLFASGAGEPEEIDFLLFCTQSPDYFLPTTACLLQDRLGIPTTAGALDYNLGCSGYVYGLALAQGLIASGQARNVLLLTGDTYTKFIHPDDRSTRTLFGDGAAATLLREASGGDGLGPFVFGTNGAGAGNLAVLSGAMRHPAGAPNGTARLSMNGPEIFRFTLETVPQAVESLLHRAGRTLETIDWFVFHQANQFMLEHLQKKIGIPREKFYVALRDVGNTVSCSIPIALKRALEDGSLRRGDEIMLVGFGVGYSWAGALMRWAA